MTNIITRILRWLWPVGLVLLLLGIGIAVSQKEFTDLATTLSVIGVALFLLIFIRGESANVKFYINVIVSSLISLAILVVIYLFGMRYDEQWDHTEARLNSLAPQSTQVLNAMNTPVRVLAFFGEETPVRADSISAVLEMYENEGRTLDIEIVDPTRDNVRVREARDRFDIEINPMDVIVENVEAGEDAGEDAKPRYKRFPFPASGQNPMNVFESNLTNAIVEVTQENQMVVYVLQGPGYKTIEQQSIANRGDSIAQLAGLLEDQAIDVRPLELRDSVPPEATVVMAVGVNSDLYEPEAEALNEFLQSGGKGLFFFAPPDRGRTELNRWRILLSNYGFNLTDRLVADLYGGSLTQNILSVIPTEFNEQNPVSEALAGARMPFNGVRAILKKPSAPDDEMARQAQALISSNESAWTIEYDETLRTVSPPPRDELESLPLVMAYSEGDAPGMTRVMTVGTSNFISDAQLTSESATLTVLALNWLAGEQERIAIPPKTFEDTPLYLKQSQMTFLFILMVLALPAVVFFGGLSYTVVRRRTR